MFSDKWPAAIAMAAALAVSGSAQTGFDGPEQAARGHELFFKTAKPEPCGNCHALGGKGTAVGPDLSVWARLAPRAAATAILATVTDKVVTVEPKAGSKFPGIKVSEDDKGTKFYDLSVSPPAAKDLAKGEFTTSSNSTWKHPPGTQEYTAEQLADIIAYIRWVGAKDRRGVKPEDVD